MTPSTQSIESLATQGFNLCTLKCTEDAWDRSPSLALIPKSELLALWQRVAPVLDSLGVDCPARGKDGIKSIALRNTLDVIFLTETDESDLNDTDVDSESTLVYRNENGQLYLGDRDPAAFSECTWVPRDVVIERYGAIHVSYCNKYCETALLEVRIPCEDYSAEPDSAPENDILALRQAIALTLGADVPVAIQTLPTNIKEHLMTLKDNLQAALREI